MTKKDAKAVMPGLKTYIFYIHLFFGNKTVYVQMQICIYFYFMLENQNTHKNSTYDVHTVIYKHRYEVPRCLQIIPYIISN